MVEKLVADNAIRENYETLLLAYAAGILDQAQQFAVAVHLAMSPPARRFVHDCERIGAALMERECSPVAMRETALRNVLEQLDAPPRRVERRVAVQLPPEIKIPVAILECLSCRPCEPRWRRSLPGLQMCDLPLECRKSSVRFIKGRPASKIPHHAHHGMEITLVLEGAYTDETGLYKRGDMMVLDDDHGHETRACRDHGVVALVVSSAPVRFSGLASLLNSFLK